MRYSFLRFSERDEGRAGREACPEDGLRTFARYKVTRRKERRGSIKGACMQYKEGIRCSILLSLDLGQGKNDSHPSLMTALVAAAEKQEQGYRVANSTSGLNTHLFYI